MRLPGGDAFWFVPGTYFLTWTVLLPPVQGGGGRYDSAADELEAPAGTVGYVNKA